MPIAAHGCHIAMPKFSGFGFGRTLAFVVPIWEDFPYTMCSGIAGRVLPLRLPPVHENICNIFVKILEFQACVNSRAPFKRLIKGALRRVHDCCCPLAMDTLGYSGRTIVVAKSGHLRGYQEQTMPGLNQGVWPSPSQCPSAILGWAVKMGLPLQRCTWPPGSS